MMAQVQMRCRVFCVQTQVHTAAQLSDGVGTKKLSPVTSPLEKEIRSSLMAIAEEQVLGS